MRPVAGDSSSGRGPKLRAILESSMHKYRDDSYHNRRKALAIRVILASSGAATTLLLGLKSSTLLTAYEPWLAALALTISATIPITTAVDAFCDFGWRWSLDRRTYHRIARILDDYDFETSGGKEMSGEVLDELYNRFRSALDDLASEGNERRQGIAGASGARSRP